MESINARWPKRTDRGIREDRASHRTAAIKIKRILRISTISCPLIRAWTIAPWKNIVFRDRHLAVALMPRDNAKAKRTAEIIGASSSLTCAKKEKKKRASAWRTGNKDASLQNSKWKDPDDFWRWHIPLGSRGGAPSGFRVSLGERVVPQVAKERKKNIAVKNHDAISSPARGRVRPIRGWPRRRRPISHRADARYMT